MPQATNPDRPFAVGEKLWFLGMIGGYTDKVTILSLPPAGQIYDVLIEHTGGWQQKTGLDHLHRDKRALDTFLAQHKTWALAYEMFAKVCKYEGLKERGRAALATPEYANWQRMEWGKGQAYADLMKHHPYRHLLST